MLGLIFFLLGLAVIAVGVLAIGFGIPNHQFGLGNTLMIAGSVAVTGGLLLLAVSAILGQLRHLNELIQMRLPSPAQRPARQPDSGPDRDKTGPLGISELVKRASQPREPASPPMPPDALRSKPAPPPDVTAPRPRLVKSGNVDGLAYSLYADGTIEAEFPEGRQTFRSIEELQRYLAGAP